MENLKSWSDYSEKTYAIGLKLYQNLAVQSRASLFPANLTFNHKISDSENVLREKLQA